MPRNQQPAPTRRTQPGPGTPVLSGPYAALAYSAEQLHALEAIKDRRFSLGVAESKYANHVLHRDGTIERLDADALVASAKTALDAVLAEDTSDPAVLERATAAARKVQEVKAAIEQERFLFVLGEDGAPAIYFQTATADNPDLPLLNDDVEDQDALAADQQAAQRTVHAAIRSAHRAAGTEPPALPDDDDAQGAQE
jgi:hypothetical protein